MKPSLSTLKAPAERVRVLRDQPANSTGSFVLYWMIAARRLHWNFSLQHALAWAHELKLPLVVLEVISIAHPYACARFHRFVLDGMANQRRLAQGTALEYLPFVEPRAHAARDLIADFSHHAAIVVTDDYPCFEYPRWLTGAAQRCTTRLEAVDSNGVLPIHQSPRAFPTAQGFRKYLQDHLPLALTQPPLADPLRRIELPQLRALPARLRHKYPPASADLLKCTGTSLAKLPIDQEVGPVDRCGGSDAGKDLLCGFLTTRLNGYASGRNHPDLDQSSGLSPYLHFGHIGAHEVLANLARQEGLQYSALEPGGGGGRRFWWGMSDDGEAFADQLITWRELGFNQCVHTPNFASPSSLPVWARRTLLKHARDPRPQVYALAELEAARTHDELWNAAQRQLLREGRIHNYLRMLWGKKILQWSPSPEAAFAAIVFLNDKYALDGRDPNSYTNIGWLFGRHDRAWGPERSIFGTVRYMSSENTARKLRLKAYLAHYGAD